MHPYGTDSRERIYFVVTLLVVSIFAGRFARWFLSLSGWNWPDELGLVLDPVSSAGIFGIVLYLFDQYVWRWPLLHRLHIVKIADVSGGWQGEMYSSFYPGMQIPTPFTIDIEQTWSRMCVRLKTDHSGSHSETASFVLEAGTGPTLSYTYLNRPKMDQNPDLAMHQGTCVVVLSRDGDGFRFEGEYYSSRGRTNYGSIWMRRDNVAV